jgi:hypothetical protein
VCVSGGDDIALTDIGCTAGNRGYGRGTTAFAQQRDVGRDAVFLEDAEILRVKRFRIDVLPRVNDAYRRQSGLVRTLHRNPAKDDGRGDKQRPHAERR